MKESSPTPEQLRAKADACDRAATAAFSDNDYRHYDDLKARSRRLRQQAREVEAGLPYEETLWRE